MILNFGSINIDHVYRVSALPEPGETLASKSYSRYLGGKGVNQSIAITRAGGEVMHLGAVGEDGDWALKEIRRLGVETDFVSVQDCATGHAIIFVDDKAENQIVIEGGANQRLQEHAIDQALTRGNPASDWVLLQNETNCATYIVDSASELGYRIAYAAAPFAAHTTQALLPKIDLLVVNEIELRALAESLGIDEAGVAVPELLVTRGAAGAELITRHGCHKQPAFSVDATDTTGAGDTFTGSFLARYDSGDPVMQALEYAAAASALQVTRAGAALAIPESDDVRQFLESR